MCGRYVLKANLPDIARMLGMDADLELAPRYNIAPTQAVPACRVDENGARTLDLLRWGLVPRWAKDLKVAYRMINARAETVAEKPAFRDAFRRRRCLLPADGYYEWKKAGERKQPYFLSRRDSRPFCFAGLWERWRGGESGPVESCAIITTTANALCAEVHDRMPVILAEQDFARWLDPALDDPGALLPLLAPSPAEAMTYVPVSTLVNNPRVDEPRCITPLAGPA